jgi:hypothetical protein
MKPLSQFLAAAVAAVLGGIVIVPLAVHAAPASLESQAKIGKADATRAALAAVPGGKVQGAELEREHGKLIWSFDIARAGASGITEVHVDAISGRIDSKTHESAAAERSEAKTERESTER